MRSASTVLCAGLPGPAGGLPVPAGVGVGDGLAECLEFGDEGAQPPVVVEPGLVVLELVVGQEPGDGLAVDFAGPLVVGAVQLRWVGVAAAARVAAAHGPFGEGAGQREGQGGDLGGDLGGAGLLAAGGRHVLMVACRCVIPALSHSIKTV